jgi:archaetidylinositol phosphate synthase
MLTTFKPIAEKSLKPLAHLLRNTSPNLISLTGLIFPVLFFVFLMNEWYALALITFIFNGMDMLDGMVARAQGKVTAFGGFLDSTIDRFADFTVLVAFGFAGLVRWEIVLPLVLLTYLISYIRSRTELAAKDKNLVASVGLVERTERLILVFIGLLFYAIFPSTTLAGQNIITLTFLVLAVLSAITVGQRVVFAYRKLQ